MEETNKKGRSHEGESEIEIPVRVSRKGCVNKREMRAWQEERMMWMKETQGRGRVSGLTRKNGAKI